MKKMLCVILAIALAVAMTGCNFQVVDTVYGFDYAIVALPDGSAVEGKVESWRDYEDSDMIQIKIDGVTYLTHSSNVVLEKRK